MGRYPGLHRAPRQGGRSCLGSAFDRTKVFCGVGHITKPSPPTTCVVCVRTHGGWQRGRNSCSAEENNCKYCAAECSERWQLRSQTEPRYLSSHRSKDPMVLVVWVMTMLLCMPPQAPMRMSWLHGAMVCPLCSVCGACSAYSAYSACSACSEHIKHGGYSKYVLLIVRAYVEAGDAENRGGVLYK